MTIEDLQIAVGAAFVLLDGWKRFDDPVRADSLATYRALHLDSRSSTTAISYFGALGLYLTSLMAAFAILVTHPTWIKTLTGTAILTNLLEGVGLPMLAALALIVVVPQLKPFSTLESSFRGRLQGWASIPVEVSRFAHDLQEYEYVAPGSPKLTSLDIDGSPTGGDASGYADSLQRHVKAEALLASLEAWKSSRVFDGYFSAFSGVHQQLQADARKLRRQVEVYQEAVLELGTESKTAHSQRDGLRDSASELLRGVCYFIAAGVLRCCPLESARNRELVRLGFVPASRTGTTLLPGQVTLCLLAVTLILFVSTIFRKEIGAALLLSVRIASLYVSATLAAVYLWHRFRRPPSRLLRDRPYHQYLCAAGLATGVCLLLSLGFRLATDSLPKALGDMILFLPYQLLTAAVAFGISFLLDDPLPQGLSAKKQRLLEGASLGLPLGLLGVLVYFWLADAPRPPAESLPVTACVVGFLLGSCIPTWCRDNRKTGRDGTESATLVQPVTSHQLAS